MPRRGQQTTLQERYAIRERAAAGESDPQIAAALGRSVVTVRKWRRLAQRHTRPDLASQTGRIPTGPLGTVPPALVEIIRQLRTAHPGWGPQTLRLELRTDPRWADQPLPSSRLAAFLKQAGMTRPYQKQRALPQPPTTPHEAWQLDAQGATTVAGLGSVSVINVADVVSRVKVERYPDVGRTPPTTADYQLTLRRAFTNFGLPERITFDHGSAFIDNTTPSPFPTLLHLWLLALGLVVLFTRKRRPTDHALIERTHQTITGQALLGQSYADQARLWAELDARREVLNTALPTRGLDDQPPLAAYPAAVHSGRPYRPEREAELLDLGRVDAYLAQGEWFRQTNCHGEFWLGLERYNVGRKWAKTEVAIRYDPCTREVVCRPGGGTEEVRFAVKGLTVADLMGEGAAVLALPAHQLALPLTRTAWRQHELAQMMPDTTR
jgi:transposase-like protein